jgi:hypothetical protein
MVTEVCQMESTNESMMEPTDGQQWELSDEELDRTSLGRAFYTLCPTLPSRG